MVKAHGYFCRNALQYHGQTSQTHHREPRVEHAARCGHCRETHEQMQSAVQVHHDQLLTEHIPRICFKRTSTNLGRWVGVAGQLGA